MRLSDLLTVEGIRTDLSATDKPSTLRALARICAESDQALNEDAVYRAFRDREEIATTGVGSGVAIPHGQIETDHSRMVMAISPEGVPFDSVDGEPAQILVGMIGPLQESVGQLGALARVSRVLKDQAVRRRLLAAETPRDAFDIMVEEEARH